MRSATHANNFDFVRVFAALCVVVSHQFALNGRPEPTLLNMHTLGGLGVLIFFSVSGFLVAQSWRADPHVLRFATRRLLRIWPALAVVVVLCTFVWGPLVSPLPPRQYLAHPQVREYLMNLVFVMRGSLPIHLEGNALPYAVNGPLWTIPLELTCYALLALLGVTGVLRLGWIVGLAFAAVAVRYAIVEVRGDLLAKALGWSLESHFLLEFGLFFALGAVLSRLLPATRKARLALALVAWGAGLLAISLARPLLGLLLTVPVTVLLVGTASTPLLKNFGRFGDVSYGLYVFAFPIQQTMIWWNRGRLPWAPLFLLTLCVCVAVALLSWHLVESRALRLKPARPQPAAPAGASVADAGLSAAPN